MRNSNYHLWNRIVSSPVVMVVALVALFFIARAAWGVHKSAESVAVKLNETQSELDRLKDQQQVLTGKVDQLSTPEGVEGELRTKYRAVKPGESVAVIVDTSVPTTSIATSISTPELSWWGRVTKFFGL